MCDLMNRDAHVRPRVGESGSKSHCSRWRQEGDGGKSYGLRWGGGQVTSTTPGLGGGGEFIGNVEKTNAFDLFVFIIAFKMFLC